MLGNKNTLANLNEQRNELTGHIAFLYSKMITAFNENYFGEGKIYYKLLLKAEKKLDRIDARINKLNCKRNFLNKI